MVKIGGSKKRKLSKNVNFTKIGGFIHSAETGGKFKIFVEIGEYTICIVDLVGIMMDAPV